MAGLISYYVHLLLDIINPQNNPVKVVGQSKGYTAHVLRREFPGLKGRPPSLWTWGKFIDFEPFSSPDTPPEVSERLKIYDLSLRLL